jgi:membrane fusion protein, multidrug efflux system
VHKLLERREEFGAERPASVAPPQSRRVRRLIILLALAALIGAAIWWWLSGPARERPGRRPAEAATVVRLGPVTKGDMPVTLDALGTVTALSTVTVKTQISGKLTEVGFTEGQSVKKGDFLAQIDPRPYQAALDQAQGQLARDEALLAAAKIDLARYEKLMTQDSIARQQVDTQRALVLQDEAIVRSDKANVENAALNLNYCRIVSPSDGRVGLRLVDPGNYLQASDPSGVVIITQMQPISVIFTLPQDAIPQFLKKLRAGESLSVLAFNRSSTTQLATGSLSTLDNQIDVTTGTVRLRATFANDDESLFPNQFVNIKLVVDTLRDATLVPSAAIQIGAPGPYVYMANADSTVSVRPIKTGPSGGERVVVVEGLAPGDNVVVDGVDRLRDGAKIRVPEAAGSSSSSSSTGPNTTGPNTTGPNPKGPTSTGPTGTGPTGTGPTGTGKSGKDGEPRNRKREQK